MGKVVQEDGRILLIAVLEVSWSKWLGAGRPSLLRQLVLWGGVLKLWFPKLSDFLPRLNV